MKKQKKHQPKNRYYRGSKLSEQRFRKVVEAFCSGAWPARAAARAGISVRSASDILKKLRKRLFEDKRLSVRRSIYVQSWQVPADNHFWIHHRECLYDCPSLRMTPYPEPIAREFLRYPQKADPTLVVWCGLCGILVHRRHPQWKWLEIWSRVNSGLPQVDYAHHVVFVEELAYVAVDTNADWVRIILDVLKSDPL